MAGDLGAREPAAVAVPTLTTARLALRPLSESDAAPLHRVWNDPDVTRYFPNAAPPPMEKVQQIILRQIRHWEERGYGW